MESSEMPEIQHIDKISEFGGTVNSNKFKQNGLSI